MDRNAASEWWNKEERPPCSCGQTAIRAISLDGDTFSIFCHSCGAEVSGGDRGLVIGKWEAIHGRS